MMNAHEELDRWLLALERERQPALRTEAVEALWVLAEPHRSLHEALAAVVPRLLADAQLEVRAHGLSIAAAVLSPVEARQLLARFAGDPNQRLRLQAVEHLADLELPDARGVLAAALTDRSVAIRFEAARGMAALGHPAGFEVLVEALGDSELRFNAAAALARLGKPEAIGPLKKAFSGWFLPPFDRLQLAGALARFKDPEGIAYLFKRIGKSWAADRAMAVGFLGECDPPGARERLRAIFQDPADTERGTAARALGRLKDLSMEPALAAVANDAREKEWIRLDAIEGLLLMGTASALATAASIHFEDPEHQKELLELREDYAANRKDP